MLSRQLLDAGHRIQALDALCFGDAAGSEFAAHPHFKRLRASFRRVESLVKAIHNIDAVIHFAAIVGEPACAMKVDLTTEIKPSRYASRTIFQSRVAR
jgi:nucleoside-diphosphate-sugar epimerase